MTALSDDDIALAGEYALGTLEAQERQQAARRIDTDPAFAAEVSLWEQSLDPMLAEIDAVAPPSASWAALNARLFPEPAGRRSRWGWLGLASGVSTALLAAVLWLGEPVQRAPGPLWISDLASDDGTVQLAALYDAARGEMRVSVGGAAPAPGRDFELWLIAGDAAPVSLGVMPREGAAAMAIPEPLRELMAGATLALTDEPEGGAPQGAASGPLIALAPLRRI